MHNREKDYLLEQLVNTLPLTSLKACITTHDALDTLEVNKSNMSHVSPCVIIKSDQDFNQLTPYFLVYG